METVTHQGRTTAYRGSDRGGDGRPLLCVHGSGGNAQAFKSQFRLSDDRPVYALDLSGHGESDDVDADPGFGSLSAYADDVIAVAEATDADFFVGSSLGSTVLLHAVLERPEFRPGGIVLAGSGPRLPVLDDLLTWLDEDFDRAVEFLVAPGRLLYDPDEQLTDLVRETLYDSGQAVVRRDFLTCHQFDVRDQLADVDVPAMAVVGEHDKLTPPWYHEELAEGIPDCEYVEVEDAAHLAMLDNPAAFNDAVSGFLAELE